MPLPEFFAEFAELLEKHGVDVAPNELGLDFSCVDGSSRTLPFTLNAARARDVAADYAGSLIPVIKARVPADEALLSFVDLADMKPGRRKMMRVARLEHEARERT